MIAMLIAEAPDAERRAVLGIVRRAVALETDEKWNYTECGSTAELRDFCAAAGRQDVMFLDLTMRGTLEIAKRLRGQFPEAYLLVIADGSISPIEYMRPSVRAESLLLKPIARKSAEEIIGEAVESYMTRFRKPDEMRMFVIENHGSRELVELDKIRYFETREKKVFVNTGCREYGYYDTLDALEARFSDLFIRCHRSFLVRKSLVANVMLTKSLVVLTDGTELPLSRSYKPLIKAFIAGKET